MDLELHTITELFDAAKPSLLALPAASLMRPRISRERALYLTGHLRGEVSPLLHQFMEELSARRAAERRADYDQLEPRAYVFYAADMAIENPWSTEKKTRRKELVRAVREHDRHLSSWAIPMFRKSDDARAAVAAILRGRGLRDDADDTLRLVSLFRKNWSLVEGKVPITAAGLTQAESDATELMGLLDSIDSDDLGSPRDLRRRAFTVWLRGYNELFHAARFLVRADPVALQRLSALSASQLSAGADAHVDEDEEEDEDEDDGTAEGPKTDRDT